MVEGKESTNDPSVRTFHEGEGWVFEANAKRAGPFSIEEMDEPAFEKNVAEELAIERKTIYAAMLAIPERKTVAVESDNFSRRFEASAGLGPEVGSSGFAFFEGADWIVSEATYLYGKLREIKAAETKSEQVLDSEGLQSVLVFGGPEKRGVKLSQDSVFRIGRRALRPTGKTLGSSGPSTLMSFEAVRQFLAGITVAPKDLYTLGIETLKSFSNLDFDRRLYDVIVCLETVSYFYDLFSAFPIGIIRAPFRSGKTRLLLCITYSTHRGMAILDPSEASIFRTGEAWKPTLVIDEFYDVTKEIERILRAVYKRGPRVPRVEKSKAGVLYLGLFDFYSKVWIGTPDAIPPNIEDKGIRIKLRKMPDPHPEKRDPRPEDFERFRNMGYIARLTWAPQIRELASALDKEELGLMGRDYEVWKPPLTIAKLIGGNTWKNVLDFAIESTEEKSEQTDEELKEVLQAIFDIVEQEAGEFPVSFKPKQLHDVIWERQKDNYRVVKSKQEIGGESSEKYDYDTHTFEQVYSAPRIGRTYLQQLGLKGKHGKGGTVYTIDSGRELNELVVRYHPGLPESESEYSNLILTPKILSQPSLLSPDPKILLKNEGDGKSPFSKGDGNSVTTTEGDRNSVTAQKPTRTVTPKIPFKNGSGDSNDGSDGILDKVEGTRRKPASFAVVTENLLRIDPTLIEDFVVRSGLTQAEQHTGYATLPGLTYAVRTRFGDSAAQLVGGLVLDMKARGVIEDDRGRLKLVRK